MCLLTVCGGGGGGNGGGSGVEGMVEEEVWWRAGGALVNAVVALGEGTCSGVLSICVCKILDFARF